MPSIKVLPLFLLLSLFCSTNTTSKQAALLPKSEVVPSLSSEESGNFTEERFHQIIDDVVSLYQDRAVSLGSKIAPIKKWDNEEVNAYATQDDGHMTIKVYGGLARHKALTEDGFALVLCHEIGHHLAGAPKKVMTHPRYGTTTLWSASEGEADYWASLKCIRKYFKKFGDNTDPKIKAQSEQTMIEKCNEVWSNTDDLGICLRTGLAGKSMANLLLSMNGLSTPVSYAHPSPLEVRRTLHEHPTPQCRLDNFLAGAICNISEELEVDPKDLRVNTCSRKEGDLIGYRPRCWFQPSDYAL